MREEGLEVAAVPAGGGGPARARRRTARLARFLFGFLDTFGYLPAPHRLGLHAKRPQEEKPGSLDIVPFNKLAGCPIQLQSLRIRSYRNWK